MTAETLRATVRQPGGSGTPEGPPEPGDPRPWRPVWRAIVLRAVLVPLVVTAPLIALAPGADHRFNLYGNGSRYLTRPWELVGEAFATVPTYLNLGNFRPLGRIVEWALDAVVFGIAELLGLPANVALRVVAYAAAVLLTLAAVVLAECLVTRGRPFAGPPAMTSALLPFAVGGGFVAAGSASTTVLFGGLYFVTGALVLAVAAVACLAVGRIRLGAWRGALAVLLGAGLAAFNEMACLAVPLATAVVLLRGRVVLGLDRRETLRGSGARFAALLWAGFLPVLLPVRAIIARRCADGGCYTGSDVSLAGVPAALPNRLTAWLPPLMWERAGEGPYGHTLGPALLLALLLLLLLARRFWRDLPRYDAPDRVQSRALAGAGAAVLLLAATLGALNAAMQRLVAHGWWGIGWRDSGLATVGGAMLTVALLAAVFARGHRSARVHRIGMALSVVLLAVVAAVSASANRDFRASGAAGAAPFVHDRVALELSDFDRTPEGDARRCALRRQFVATLPATHRTGYPAELRRFDQALDRAAGHLAGRRFCSAAPR
ncbi:hypothetical protein [Actinoplanes sp. NPDC051851]|uniref:hypothetical protein n=1 Tax=Actinoplanes sp. NPDC051851 TaxID=3154753 RepID=UPI00342E4C92